MMSWVGLKNKNKTPNLQSDGINFTKYSFNKLWITAAVLLSCTAVTVSSVSFGCL